MRNVYGGPFDGSHVVSHWPIVILESDQGELLRKYEYHRREILVDGKLHFYFVLRGHPLPTSRQVERDLNLTTQGTST